MESLSKCKNLFPIPDFHSHLLPCLDDGSKSVEMSLGMLAQMAEQGIGEAVATPHFYPTRDDMGRFLQLREESIRSLRSGYDPTRHPKLYVGAEVAYYHGISRSDRLRELCIRGTTYLLLEMPFSRWTDEVIGEVLALEGEQGVKPILAHIERYLPFQKRRTIPFLAENEILMQANASFLLNKKTEKKAIRFLNRGLIHLLGSDCHNLSSRKPNLGEALEKLAEQGSAENWRRIQKIGRGILDKAIAIE